MANKDILELVFKHSGGVELRAVTDKSDPALDTVIWASDSDQDFMDEFSNEIFDAKDQEEVAEIIDYLVEADVIDDDEAEGLQIWSEALDGRDVESVGTGPDDDEPDDDDEGDDDEFGRHRVGAGG
jgi:hypothetical protein